MEFSPTTFVFEIVNFLVLIWILQRFLYKPVMDSLAQRKAAIETSVGGAEQRERAAAELQRRYEERMAAWHAEREQARSRLADEIAAERARMMTGLQGEIADERYRNRALEARRATELQRELERRAHAAGARFASSLLSRMAGPELEKSICQVFIEDLPLLALEQAAALRNSADADGAVRIASAYPLDDGARTGLKRALERTIGCEVACEFVHEPELVAGVRVTAGPWALRCDLADGLADFAQTANGPAN